MVVTDGRTHLLRVLRDWPLVDAMYVACDQARANRRQLHDATPDQKARVPDKNYRAALGFLKGTEENELSEEVAAAQHPDSKK